MNIRLMTAVALAFGSMPIHAADMTDSAPVVTATPIVDRVTEPRQECAPAPSSQRAPQERSVLGPIIGGVAGALLGSTVGRGNGRTAATAAGAIGGAIVGDHVGNQQSAAQQPQQQCRTVESTREIIRGYTVVYRYNGRDVTTTMPYDPGMRVNVSVTAITDGPGRPMAPAAMGGNGRDGGRDIDAPRDQGYGPQPVYTEQRVEQRFEQRNDPTYRY
jgi:uncharacterized protein YcfJ